MRGSFSAATFAFRQNTVQSLAGTRSVLMRKSFNRLASAAPPSTLSALTTMPAWSSLRIRVTSAGFVKRTSRMSSSATGVSVRRAATYGIRWPLDFMKSTTMLTVSLDTIRPGPKPSCSTPRPGASEAMVSNASMARGSGVSPSARPLCAIASSSFGTSLPGPCFSASVIASRNGSAAASPSAAIATLTTLRSGSSASPARPLFDSPSTAVSAIERASSEGSIRCSYKP